LPGNSPTLTTLKGGTRMSVLVQFQLPVDYDQFQAIDKQINPENLLPTGCLVHVVSQNDGSITVTDVWEDEQEANKFYEGIVETTGMQMPPRVFTKVLELLP
jgi:hypothetical protein